MIFCIEFLLLVIVWYFCCQYCTSTPFWLWAMQSLIEIGAVCALNSDCWISLLPKLHIKTVTANTWFPQGLIAIGNVCCIEFLLSVIVWCFCCQSCTYTPSWLWAMQSLIEIGTVCALNSDCLISMLPKLHIKTAAANTWFTKIQTITIWIGFRALRGFNT